MNSKATSEGMIMIEKGMYLFGMRKDFRVIKGVVESVRPMPKGTLVVLSEMHDGQVTYKSLYLEEARLYRVVRMDNPQDVVVSFNSW